MTLESLKDLIRKTKTEFDEFKSVHEFDGDLFGTFIEGYDKCRPIACEMHGEKTIPRMVSDLNLVCQIERGMEENGLTRKYVQALDSEGTDMEYATPAQRCLAAMKVLLPEELAAEATEAEQAPALTRDSMLLKLSSLSSDADRAPQLKLQR